MAFCVLALCILLGCGTGSCPPTKPEPTMNYKRHQKAVLWSGLFGTLRLDGTELLQGSYTISRKLWFSFLIICFIAFSSKCSNNTTLALIHHVERLWSSAGFCFHVVLFLVSVNPHRLVSRDPSVLTYSLPFFSVVHWWHLFWKI